MDGIGRCKADLADVVALSPGIKGHPKQEKNNKTAENDDECP